MNLPAQSNPDENPLETFDRELEAEYERAKQTKKEIDLMLKQSEQEMAKLTKRNADVSAQLQQVQSQIETMPRGDIKSTYNSAMDAQQRLLVMRGQLEKMQNDVASWARYIALLEKVIEQLSRGFKPSGGGGGMARSMNSGSMMLENMINAQEAERESLSKRMHDGPAQALSNFIVQAEIASRFLDIDAIRAKEEMVSLKNAALSTFREVRTFIFELRPMMLDDLGLIPTINRYCESFKEQTGCDVTCSIKGGTQDRKFLSFQSSMVFRAIQELIGNAYRHNSENPTRIQIGVNVVVDENVIKVTVNDNGKGFEPEHAFRNDKMSGLRIIRERVEMLGGHMEIDSGIGRGARIFFQVPILESDN
jgi:two-component system, NarL family, sensor histidine kinase DegS